MRILVSILCGFGSLALGQPADTPARFTAADVHVSAKMRNPFLRNGAVHDGRYEIKNATMLDLLQTAYGFTKDKILGGPNWLELDRYDVIGKVPADTKPDALKTMLQTLLKERFQLVARQDTKPLPGYALTLGKKPMLKEADGAGESGCRTDTAAITGGSAIKIGGGVAAGMGLGNANNGAVTLYLGPGGTINFHCKNMTMPGFADWLRGMMGPNTNAVLEETGLKGQWNFDVRWTMLSDPNNQDAERTTMYEAVDKQLGLKLESRPVPTPVLLVDSVNEKPAANPADTATVLPPILPPTKFEVASVKSVGHVGPGTPIVNRLQPQPGGRLTIQSMTMRFLISRAFNTFTSDQIAGLPDWADSEMYDVMAKAPVEAPAAQFDPDWWGPMMQSLLADRFKLAYHDEDRPVMAYTLLAAKPKMKKADPAERISCKTGAPPAGSPPGSLAFTCQNVTMAQLAERLQQLSNELTWPVADATGLEGGWDFTLIFSQMAGMPMGGRGRGGDGAAEPTGAVTLFDAIEKQLGLKLEKQKRPERVMVIDHLEQKPTEN